MPSRFYVVGLATALAWVGFFGTTASALNCLGAPFITCGQTVHGDNSSNSDSQSSYGSCGAGLTKGESVYKLQLNFRQDIAVQLTTSAITQNVLVLNGCNPTACLGSATANVLTPGTVQLPNLNPGTYVIVVDGGLLGGEGSFDLKVTCGSSLDCSSARPILCGQTVQGTTVGGTNHGLLYNCVTTGLDGPDVIYELYVSQTVDLVAALSGLNPPGPFDQMHLMLLRSCTASSCVGHASITRLGGALNVANVQPGTYYLIVDAPQGIESPFTLKVDCVKLDCTQATTISCGGAVDGDTRAKANQAERYGCFNFVSLPGGEDLYKFTLTQNDDVYIRFYNVAVPGASQMYLFFLDGCSINNCVQYASASNGGATSLPINGLQAGTYYILVDSTSSQGGTYTMEVYCGDITDPARLEITQVSGRNLPEIGVTFKVRDRIGNFVSGLTANDFMLTENTVSQSITRLEETQCGTSVQVSIALVLDHSGSMGSGTGSELENAKQSARDLINILSPGDRASITEFDDQVNTIQGMTSNHSLLISAINTISYGGNTAVFDGAYEGVRLCVPEPGTKAVFVFTDGEDNSSSHSPSDVINYALANGVPVYTIQLGGSGNSELQNIAYSTGGTYASAPSAADLATIYANLYRNLKSVYHLTYNTSNPSPDNTFRAINLCIRPGNVCDQDGYIAEEGCQWYINQDNPAGKYRLQNSNFVAQQMLNTNLEGPMRDLSVEIFFDNNVTSEVDVSFWNDSNDRPGTKLIDADQRNAIIDCPGWYGFTFTASTQILTAGNKYWIAVQHKNRGVASLVYNLTGPVGGLITGTGPTTPAWGTIDPSRDLFMRIYGCSLKPTLTPTGSQSPTRTPTPTLTPTNTPVGPTYTPTPTVTPGGPTLTPSPTPLPATSTPTPSATPTPTLEVPTNTPNPAHTPTPTPTNGPGLPDVYAAGYMGTVLTNTAGGTLVFLAIADENAFTGEFFVGGAATGITAGQVDSVPPLAVLSTNLPLGGGAAPGHYLLEFRAGNGRLGAPWPYLNVRP